MHSLTARGSIRYNYKNELLFTVMMSLSIIMTEYIQLQLVTHCPVSTLSFNISKGHLYLQ